MRFLRAILRYYDIALSQTNVQNSEHFFAIIRERYCVTFHAILRFPQCGPALINIFWHHQGHRIPALSQIRTAIRSVDSGLKASRFI